jgi:iron(III) transport system substrate-binding protein
MPARRPIVALVGLTALVLAAAACGDDDDSASGSASASASASGTGSATVEGGDVETDVSGDELVVYSGRNDDLVGELLERFADEYGVDLQVRYGDTTALAAQIAEEGGNTPADVFFAQDAGSLGFLAAEGRLQALPEDVLGAVDAPYRSDDGLWVGTSARVRVLAFNPDAVAEADLPPSVDELTGDEWADRVGWAPQNPSFQAFVTAMRVQRGDDATREWLEAMQDNGVTEFPNNLAIVDAVAEGELDVGLVNHYYIVEREHDAAGDDATCEARIDAFGAVNHFFTDPDIGGLVNVAGVGLLDGSDHEDAALAFVRFLLEEEAQTYFAQETGEYPVAAGVAADPCLPPLTSLHPPDIDLSDLSDARGTVELLTDLGLL